MFRNHYIIFLNKYLMIDKYICNVSAIIKKIFLMINILMILRTYSKLLLAMIYNLYKLVL
jgi:hypothetical protein